MCDHPVPTPHTQEETEPQKGSDFLKVIRESVVPFPEHPPAPCEMTSPPHLSLPRRAPCILPAPSNPWDLLLPPPAGLPFTSSETLQSLRCQNQSVHLMDSNISSRGQRRLLSYPPQSCPGYLMKAWGKSYLNCQGQYKCQALDILFC